MIEMPHLITLDFETFYDTKFSLSRLTTEEYIRSSDFEIIGVGIKIDDAPAYWVSGSGIKSKVRRYAKRFWRSSADENKSDNRQTNIRAG
jgi:hypothetical protein